MRQGLFKPGTARRRWCLRLGFGLFLAATVLVAGLYADPPACPTPCPPEAPLPPTPQKGPRPPAGPKSIASFVDDLSSNDSAFDVILGEGRILTTKVDLAVAGKPPALVAVGDPTVLDFAVINARQIRVVGLRIGVTDLSITTSDNQIYSFEVRVVADLTPLRGKLCALFPDACLKLTQIRDHIAVEGQARDSVQVTRIIETIHAYLNSIQTSQNRKINVAPAGAAPLVIQPKAGLLPVPQPLEQPNPQAPPAPVGLERAAQPSVQVYPTPQIINLIHVPGSQQVLLKVRVAELNRTALRQIGMDWVITSPRSGMAIGTNLGAATVTAAATTTSGAITETSQSTLGAITPVFGIFEKGHFATFLDVLRQNSLLKILAEPNLVALNGHAASFLSGGEFPVPVPQTGGGGIAPTITIQFKEFGVRLTFVPTILDGDVIRLVVDPEVSTIDKSIGTVIVPGGSVVPGLDTRKAHSVVEMREGQTLAIAGLLQLSLDAQTTRIPGLGDLPILGPFFSNTTNTRTEKELLILVTPYLVEPMEEGQVPALPGSEVGEPGDLEFYFTGRIESATGRDTRSTVGYDILVPRLRALFHLDHRYVRGPVGFCD
jgi:pilus assembly protein CpaC